MNKKELQERIDELETAEFMIQMADHWTQEDYQRVSEIRAELKDLESQLCLLKREESHEELNIKDNTPRLIRCKKLEDVYGGLDGKGRLVVDEIYHMSCMLVHSWYTEVFLEEFPDLDIGFNSVLFEEV